MTPVKMVLTNNAPKRIRLERRDWRELAETRLPATTHHMLTQTATPWEELKTEWFKAKCKKEQPTQPENPPEKKPWKKPERL